MPIAHSYIRFSSKKQEHGDSLNRQMEKTEAYCIKNNIELSKKRYQDLGISAYRNATRPSLDDMFAAIESGAIKPGDYIILEALDRLSRRGIDATTRLTSDILKSGVKIVILQDEQVLDETSVDDLVAVIRIAVAADIGHKESKQKSLRVQSAKNAQKEKAKNKEFIAKKPVFWLSKNKSNDGYVFNDKKELIELVVSLREQGVGFHKIAIYLNTNNKYKPPRAKHWSDQTIRQFILSPALYGAYQVGKVVDGKFNPDRDGLVQNYFPAIVSFSRWKKLQPEFITRVGGNSEHNHLAGLVRCADCGKPMGKKISKRKTRTKTHLYKNWYCLTNRVGGCNQKITVKDLDEVIFYLCKYISIENLASAPNTNALEEEIYNIELRINDIEERLTDINTDFNIFANTLEKLHEQKDTKHALLTTERNSMSEIKESDIKKILSFKTDPVLFNRELRLIAKNIVVQVRSAKSFRLTMNLRNGQPLHLWVQRKSERANYDYLFSSENADIKNPELFEWEQEFRYSSDEEYSKIGQT
jgi:DNA invertase Pin-like site-specific DNA recombinase